MDKINMINYQQHILQTKFGKRKQEKKRASFFSKVVLVVACFVLLYVFFSLLFLNTETQVLNSSSFFPGFLNIGDLSHG
jgi:hypothetical protein